MRLPGPRFAIVDYKTNWLGAADEPLTLGCYAPAALAAEMQRAHYGLQALLYTVALHRYLRCAPARLRPRPPPRGRALPVRARDGGPGHPGARRRAVRRVRVEAAGPARVGVERRARPGARRERAGAGGDDRFDARRSLGARGLLRVFNEAGVLSAADVHVAMRLARADRRDERGGAARDRLRRPCAPAWARVRRLATIRDTATVDADDELVELSSLPWPAVDGLGEHRRGDLSSSPWGRTIPRWTRRCA